ncbi:MAG: gamma carbonic anhydrase family protein [Chloroflexota bacterium]|nr:MAG: gamma carbonic anhydrase family protein [Chloroflexota bacterium]
MKYAFEGKAPEIDPTAYVAPTAVVIGDVTIGPRSSIWFGAVLRGDVFAITIGAGTSIQDSVVIHEHTIIGDDCLVGHSAIVHGCRVGNNVLIGSGAIVFDGCVVEDGAVIAMGAVLAPNTHVPAGTVMIGVPAQPVRRLTAEEMQGSKDPDHHYENLARRYQVPGALQELP